MRDVQDFNIADTAAALGVSEGVVKTRLLRARLMMQKELAPKLNTGTTRPARASSGVRRGDHGSRLQTRLAADFELHRRHAFRLSSASAIETHLANCRHCAAVLDSTRNILVLVADDRTFELPVGYSDTTARPPRG